MRRLCCRRPRGALRAECSNDGQRTRCRVGKAHARVTTPPPSHQRVTRADVARYAGVSSAVVSYVVNNGPRPVAPATAARVLEAIRVLGYRPNASARALRSGSTMLLGLVVPEIGNPLFAELALAVEAEAASRGYALLLTNSENDPLVERRHILNLVGRQIDGLLLTTTMAPPDLGALPLAGIPTVLLNTFEETPGFFGVGVDAFAGAYTATSHLIGHGRSSVALVIGGQQASSDELRERGWRKAGRDAGLVDGFVGREEWSRAGGYRAGQRLFAGKSYPDAIFVSSDLQAIGALRALRERGLRVPEDVAVVSFDGTQDSEYSAPRLTAMRQPVQAMAADAIHRVLGRGQDGTVRHRLHKPELIVRDSCGCSSPSMMVGQGTAATPMHVGGMARPITPRTRKARG